MSAAEELILIADQLRVIAEVGLSWTQSDPYNRGRYERVRHAAAELFAFTDTRAAKEIERTVFSQLTHTACVPCVDAAVIDEAERILLIQRADDELWAMPGGGIEVGETAAQAAVRETREEAGLVVEVLDIGWFDRRELPALSPGQTVRVPGAFRFLEERRPFFDPD